MRTFIASTQLLSIAVLASTSVTACSGSSAVPPTLGASSLPVAGSAALPASVAFRQSAGKSAKRAKPLLYVAGFSAQAVFVYDQSEKSPGDPIYKITNGISDPNGLATDTSGNLYVTNDLTNALTIYTPGSRNPIESITTGVNVPFAVAVDSVGDIFVANDPSGQSPYINEYVDGESYPIYTWYPPVSNSTITGLALMTPNQSGGTIEAAYYTFDQYGNAHGDLMQCYQGNSSCSNDGYSFGRTGGVTVASSQPLNILVADQSAPGIWNLNGSSTQLIKTSYDPWFMAFNKSHSALFVSDGGTTTTQYAYPRMKAKKTFIASGGYEGPFVTGVATSPSGAF